MLFVLLQDGAIRNIYNSKTRNFNENRAVVFCVQKVGKSPRVQLAGSGNSLCASYKDLSLYFSNVPINFF